MVAAPICIPNNSAQGFPFLHILTNTYMFHSKSVFKVTEHCGFNLHFSHDYNMHPYVHCSYFNSQDMAVTQVPLNRQWIKTSIGTYIQ